MLEHTMWVTMFVPVALQSNRADGRLGGCRDYCTYSCFISVVPTVVQLFHVPWLIFCLKQKHSFCFLLNKSMGNSVCISHDVSVIPLNMILNLLDEGSRKVARTSLFSLIM